MAIYLKLDGIDGDATHQDHRNWMRIENLDLGVRRKFRTRAGVTINREGRQPALSPVRLAKRSCRATPLLMTESLAGSRSKTAVIHVVDTGSPGRTYIEVTLSNVLISRYQIDGEGGRPLESFHLDATKIEMRYIPRADDNSGAAPMVASYDMATSQSA
jgi:type VI secretion system secreted protein Hcp